MKRIHSYIYPIIVITILTLASCGKEDKSSLASKKAELKELNLKVSKLKEEIVKLEPIKIDKAIDVTVTPIIASTFEHFVEATGRLEAENNQFVSPQMGGAITNVYVKVGDYVVKGQKIASIDNSIMINSIQEVQLQLETAKTIFERQKALWDQKIGTEVQYIQAKSQVESLERRITTMKTQNNMNLVVSPISGMVDEVRLKAGEMAAPGIGIVRVVNMTQLKVVANIPDTYAGTINKGAAINLKFPDLGREVNTRVNYVSQTINPVSRTFTIEAKLPVADKNFKPNLSAMVKINDKAKANSIVIPQNLVQNTEQGSIVYVVGFIGKNCVAKAKKVTIGQSYNGKVEILSGIAVGDQIIMEGFQEVVDDQLIKF